MLIAFFFFFNDTATTEIYTLSLHDALPICSVDGLLDGQHLGVVDGLAQQLQHAVEALERLVDQHRSEEHTSELQSHSDLVCRLLLEKKKNMTEHRYCSV